jgi:hypothetical protein
MEERMKILGMVQEGKLSAAEAEKLLQALEGDEMGSVAGKGKVRWLRVRVYDKDSQTPKVKVNVPVALLKIGAKMGAKFNMGLPEKARAEMEEKGIDLSAMQDPEKLQILLDGLTSEGPFKLVDVEEENERVEVFLE